MTEPQCVTDFMKCYGLQVNSSCRGERPRFIVVEVNVACERAGIRRRKKRMSKHLKGPVERAAIAMVTGGKRNRDIAGTDRRIAVEAIERRERAAQGTVEQEQKQRSDKTGYIESLKVTYEKDRERRGAGVVPQWDGSGHQLLLWHYEKSLGRYFNNPTEIKRRVFIDAF